MSFAQLLEEQLKLPAVAPGLPQGQVHVWSVNLEQIPAQVESLNSFLSAEEWAQSRRFSQPAQVRAFALRRALLRQLLSRYAACGPLDLDYRLGEHGKPRATGPADGIGFSVSSSGQRVLFAFAGGAELGVDLELLRWRAGLDGVAERYFNPAERALLAAAPSELRPSQFFRIWTRKEAEAKLSGEGLAALLEAPFGERPLQSVCEELPVAEGYVAHLAVNEARLRVKILHWSPDWPRSSTSLYNPPLKG